MARCRNEGWLESIVRIKKLNVDCPKWALGGQGISSGSEKEKGLDVSGTTERIYFVEMLLQMYDGEDRFLKK